MSLAWQPLDLMSAGVKKSCSLRAAGQVTKGILDLCERILAVVGILRMTDTEYVTTSDDLHATAETRHNAEVV